MEAGKRSVSQIFDRNRVLEIPFFQRSYVWKTENWERFLRDMQTVSSEGNTYFFGSIILKQQLTPADGTIGDWRIIVDGQQRLTTLLVFFKVLCQAIDHPEEFKENFFNRTQEISLKHNHNDVEVFEAIINDTLDDNIRKNNRGNHILECYDFFMSNTDVIKNINQNRLLNNIYFVGIDLGKDEDEQQIFDTINSLGISLTTAELLKNELFRREDENLFNDTWKQAFEAEHTEFWSQEVTAGRQRRANIDLLLQSYLLLISEAKDKYISLENLFRNFQLFMQETEIIRQSPQHTAFINGLMTIAGSYRTYLQPMLMNSAINKHSAIEHLNVFVFGLKTTTIVPYILFLVQKVDDSTERDRIFNLLETYLIRRLICKETTKNYNNLFASFIRNNIITYDELREKLCNSDNQTDQLPNDDMLYQGFQNSTLTNLQAKAVLYLIEVSCRDPHKESTALLGFNNYSLEHVMPKKWRNHWNKSDTIIDENTRDQKLLKLGNLTLITASLNSSIRDLDWNRKKNGTSSKPGLKEYTSGIKIFGPSPLIDADKWIDVDEWNENTIDARAKFLYEHALVAWPIPD